MGSAWNEDSSSLCALTPRLALPPGCPTHISLVCGGRLSPQARECSGGRGAGGPLGSGFCFPRGEYFICLPRVSPLSL